MADAADLLVNRLRALLDPARHETAPDGELLGRWVAERDARAFAALVWRHGGMVWRVARSVLPQIEDAEDVFQATFLVLARKAASLQRRSSPAGWLYQTAYRLALKTRTATARRLRREDEAKQKTAADPLEEISVREARSILTEELERLPAVHRDPLLLCLYEGATQDEAARQLGCSLKTLQRRLERGRNLLNMRLTRRGLAPAGALALTLFAPSAAPARLVQQTIMAAGQFVYGQDLVSAAAVLAQGVLRLLLAKKLAVCLTVVCALSGLTMAAGYSLVPTKQVQASKPSKGLVAKDEPPPPQQPAPRLDRYGDVLPEGALNRLGSTIFRHGDVVQHVLYMPDGRALASFANDGFLRLWDAKTGKHYWRFAVGNRALQGVSALAVSSDGKKLAVMNVSEYALVTTETGKRLAGYEWPKGPREDAARCVAISPDLCILARGCFDGTVRLFDAATGKEKLRIAAADKAQNDTPRTIKFSADSKTVHVVVFQKSDIMAYDTATGKAVQPLIVAQFSARFLSVSPDCRHLAAIVGNDPPDGKNQAIFWDLATGKQRQAMDVPYAFFGGAFSSDSGLFAIGQREIVLFDSATGKERGRWPATGGVTSLAFAPDGKTLVAADNTGCLTLWDIATGNPGAPTPEPKGSMHGLRFLAEGKQLLTNTYMDGIYWWDISSGKAVRHLSRGSGWSVGGWNESVSPDQKLVAMSTFDPLPDGTFKGDILLVDTTTGQSVRTLTGHKWGVCDKVFSPDGTKLFSVGGYDPRIITWDVATGKSLQEWVSHSRFVDRLAVSSDGRWLASATPESRGPADDNFDIRLWNAATGKLVHRLTPSRYGVNRLVFSADSSQLMSVGGVLQLWNITTGKEVLSISWPEVNVSSVAMTTDGRMLAVGGEDKTIRLWEVASGKERRRIDGHDAPIDNLVFSPDSKLLAAASFDAPVYLWDVYGLETSIIPAANLTKASQEKLWQRLADIDAAEAFKAVCELIRRPKEAVSLLEEGWKRSPRATAKEIEKWVEELNNDQFAVRKNATAKLEQFVTGHEESLRKALEKAGSLEVRQRLEKILAYVSPERLRRNRMLEVLEQINTPQARHLLESFAAQQVDTVFSRDSAAGLKRLEKLSAPGGQ